TSAQAASRDTTQSRCRWTLPTSWRWSRSEPPPRPPSSICSGGEAIFMASLRDALTRLLAVPGVRSVVIVGRDGLPIEATGRGDERFLDTLGALGASALGVTEALGAEFGQERTVATLLEYEDAFVSVDPLGDYAAIV